MTRLDNPTWTQAQTKPLGNDTGAANAASLASAGDEEAEHRRAWDDVIDRKLIEWGRNPSQLAEDELDPPSADAIRAACDAAYWLRDKKEPPPGRVVPNGDGGAAFELWLGSIVVMLEFFEDGSSERTVYDDCRIVARERYAG